MSKTRLEKLRKATGLCADKNKDCFTVGDKEVGIRLMSCSLPVWISAASLRAMADVLEEPEPQTHKELAETITRLTGISCTEGVGIGIGPNYVIDPAWYGRLGAAFTKAAKELEEMDAE